MTPAFYLSINGGLKKPFSGGVIKAVKPGTEA